jgi:hypothetical protein
MLVKVLVGSSIEREAHPHVGVFATKLQYREQVQME